jgi:hypothetical protein
MQKMTGSALKVGIQPRFESSDKQSKLPTLAYTMCEALQILFLIAGACSGDLATLLFAKLFSSIIIISMISSPGSSRETGHCLYLIPRLKVLDHLYLSESLDHNICLFFLFVMLQKYLLFDWISGI